jgi:hypothetical protein
VRIHHGSFIDERPHIDEHGRHADHRRRDIGAQPHGRSPRHDADAVANRKSAGGEGVLVDEGKAGVLSHFAQFAQAKSQQDTQFHPDIDNPASTDFFRSANFSLGEFVAEVHENLARIRIALDFAERGETFNRRLEGLHERPV